jgi:hypothetical protein
LAGISLALGALRGRASRVLLAVVLAILLLWLGLLFLEGGGSRPVHTFRLINTQDATAAVPGPAPTVSFAGNGGAGNGQNCNDNDNQIGEGSPADLLADAGNGNGTGGDGCPSGI